MGENKRMKLERKEHARASRMRKVDMKAELNMRVTEKEMENKQIRLFNGALPLLLLPLFAKSGVRATAGDGSCFV